MLNLVNFKSQTPTMKFPRIKKKLIQFDVDIWLWVFLPIPRKGNKTKYTNWIDVSRRDTCKNGSYTGLYLHVLFY
jgi:hypothetical protein